MVTKKSDLYQCDECFFLYRNEKTAQLCEDWCRDKKSCNIEITKLAVKE